MWCNQAGCFRVAEQAMYQQNACVDIGGSEIFCVYAGGMVAGLFQRIHHNSFIVQDNIQCWTIWRYPYVSDQTSFDRQSSAAFRLSCVRLQCRNTRLPLLTPMRYNSPGQVAKHRSIVWGCCGIGSGFSHSTEVACSGTLLKRYPFLHK